MSRAVVAHRPYFRTTYPLVAGDLDGLHRLGALDALRPGLEAAAVRGDVDPEAAIQFATGLLALARGVAAAAAARPNDGLVMGPESFSLPVALPVLRVPRGETNLVAVALYYWLAVAVSALAARRRAPDEAELWRRCLVLVRSARPLLEAAVNAAQPRLVRADALGDTRLCDFLETNCAAGHDAARVAASDEVGEQPAERLYRARGELLAPLAVRVRVNYIRYLLRPEVVLHIAGGDSDAAQRLGAYLCERGLANVADLGFEPPSFPAGVVVYPQLPRALDEHLTPRARGRYAAASWPGQPPAVALPASFATVLRPRTRAAPPPAAEPVVAAAEGARAAAPTVAPLPTRRRAALAPPMPL